jgi:UDPglucose--hexose-1-phosphate uridylyltransferase
MAELRDDPLTGRVALLAPQRAARPITAPAPLSDAAPNCPFCPGREDQTPPEVARVGTGAPDTPGWRVRVVPNLYPILDTVPGDHGISGLHEVLVLSPDHHHAFEQLTDDQACELITVLRDRSRWHQSYAHVQPLLNQGRAAGASIAHPHAQLVALDVVPPAVTAAVERFTGSGIDLLVTDARAARAHELVVVDTDQVQAWCPFASTVPFEVRLGALDAGPDFAGATDEQVRGVALALRRVLAAAMTVLDHPAYNVVFHTAPAGTSHHWWLEIVPRTTVAAGFELATGLFVNVTDPHHAATALRTEI